MICAILLGLIVQAWSLKERQSWPGAGWFRGLYPSTEETKLQVKEHAWPCKNGNLFRTGASGQLAGPSDIEHPDWVWLHPGHTCNAVTGRLETTPLIDRDSNIYVGTSMGEIHKLSRGKVDLWTVHEPARIMTGALDGDSMYVGTSTGVALSIDLATGKVNWRKKYSSTAGADAWTTTVANGTAIVAGADEEMTERGGNKYVVALSTVDGSEKWRFSSPGVFYNFMPVVSENSVVFIDDDGRLYSVSLSSGALQWQSKQERHRHRKGSSVEHATSGVVRGPNDLVYANFNTDGQSGGAVVAYDMKTGRQHWRRDLGLRAVAAPAVGQLGPNGQIGVVVGTGTNVDGFKPPLREPQARLMAFDALTGADLWTFEPPLPHDEVLPTMKGIFAMNNPEYSLPETWSTPAIGSDGVVYVAWQGGKAFSLTGTTGEVLSTFASGFGCQGEPAIGDGFIVIATCGHVAAF